MRCKPIVISFLIMVMAGTLSASEPLLNLPYNITSVDTLPSGLFRLNGSTHDNSPLGFGSPSVTTGDYVVVQSHIYGDIDLYSISNIWSQAGALLICDVGYAEGGTPRAGQPEAGEQLICRSGYLYSVTFGMSEYLNNGARNLFMHLLENRIDSFSSTSTATNFVISYSGEQIVNDGDTIIPYGNVKVNNTNAAIIALGNPQVTTNGIADGTIMFVRGAADTSAIQFVDGSGLSLDCSQFFFSARTT